MRLYGNYRRRSGIFLFIILLTIIMSAFFMRSIKVINSIAKTVAVQKTTEIMNTCALEHIGKAGEIYNAMLIKEKNSTGTVSSIDANVQKLNLLQTDIAEIMTKELKAQRKINFRVSFINLLGYNVISDRGIKIPIEFVPITRVETSFKESFISAGINQTMLTVNLKICANMRISVFPGGTSQKVIHTIPIAKIVIVGETPSGFYRGDLK